MQAVILAGGLCTRLGPLTTDRPKALVEVCGRPFIDYQLALLARSGVRSVVLCTGHLGALIEAHVGDGAAHGLRVAYSREGEQLLGIPGALRAALPLLGERFFVTYGDAYLALDYGTAAQAFEPGTALAMVAVTRNRDPHHRNEVRVEARLVTAFDKPHAGPGFQFLNYGVTFMRREALARVPAGGGWTEHNLYRSLIAEHSLRAYETDAPVLEIGRPKGLRRFTGSCGEARWRPRPPSGWKHDGTRSRAIARAGREQLDVASGQSSRSSRSSKSVSRSITASGGGSTAPSCAAAPRRGSQTAANPAACAPVMSADSESPTCSAAAAGTPARRPARSHDRRSRAPACALQSPPRSARGRPAGRARNARLGALQHRRPVGDDRRAVAPSRPRQHLQRTIHERDDFQQPGVVGVADRAGVGVLEANVECREQRRQPPADHRVDA